jgi:hypothetical protein
MADGTCSKPGVNPDLWFPESPEERVRAESLCAACPVVEACRSWSLREWVVDAHHGGFVVGGWNPWTLGRARKRLGIDGPNLADFGILRFKAPRRVA